MRIRPGPIALVTCVLALAAGQALANTQFGVRTGVYTDIEAGFVGAEVVTGLSPAWYFNPNLEYAFDGDRDVLAVSGDFHYDFFQDRPYYVWAGAGPAVLVRENVPGDRHTDLGLNMLGGIGWKKPNVEPYFQGKVTASDDPEAVIAFGLRF